MSSGTETLWAVVVGALLATAGGFSASRLEEFIRRRQRERGAALLFGEILAVIERIAVLAAGARERGDPFGPLTMRLLRAIRRETEVYERNREALSDLRDPKLRAEIHALMVRVILALEGVFDATAAIAETEKTARPLAADDPIRLDAETRIDGLIATRQAAFDFAMETAAQAKPLLSALRPLARYSFEAHAAVVSGV